MKKTLLLALFFAVLSLPAFARPRGDQVTVYEIPRSLPTREFYTSAGKPIRLSSFSGQLTLVVFWSKHCAPCVRKLRDLMEFHEDGITKRLVYGFGHVSTTVTTPNAEIERLFFHQNRLNSTSMISDLQGNILAYVHYDEWGNVTGGDITFAQFTGHRFDKVYFMLAG